MFCKQKNGLKGQYSLAQGKRRRSVALGWRSGNEIVRAKMCCNEQSNIRTKWSIVNFHADNLLNPVRKMDFVLINMVSRTVFILHILPRAAFRFVPSETLPWAIICRPFRPKKFSHQLVYKE